jgi:hypothetical protein
VVSFTPMRFTTEERSSGTELIGGWLGFRDGLNTGEEKNVLPLPKIEPRSVLKNPGRSVLRYAD